MPVLASALLPPEPSLLSPCQGRLTELLACAAAQLTPVSSFSGRKTLVLEKGKPEPATGN